MGKIAKEKRRSAKTTIVGAHSSLAQERGFLAEERAIGWLTGQGLELVARNVRCRGGEIDAICLERDTLVFAEVRLRTDPRYGGALESITAGKRRRILFTARWWLTTQGHAHQHRPCRFDVILFDGAEADVPQWIRGAFEDG
ncbi:MAG: YraN family protein [Azoarcus sp.]|jgi:putative endonuclease|nr:YraN family protein [Azoarcus sp.]